MFFSYFKKVSSINKTTPVYPNPKGVSLHAYWQRTERTSSCKGRTLSNRHRQVLHVGKLVKGCKAGCSLLHAMHMTPNNNGEQHLQLLYHGELIQSFHLMYHLLSSVVNSCCITKKKQGTLTDSHVQKSEVHHQLVSEPKSISRIRAPTIVPTTAPCGNKFKNITTSIRKQTMVSSLLVKNTLPPASWR